MLNRLPDWQDPEKTRRPAPPALPSSTPFFGKGVRVLDKNFVPQEGFYKSSKKNTQTQCDWTAYVVQIHSSRIVDAIIALMKPLGKEMDVVVKDIHRPEYLRVMPTYLAEDVEQVVVESTLRQFQTLLENDGRMSLALLANDKKDLEIQFTDDKTLHCYAPEGQLAVFHRILHSLRVPHNAKLSSIHKTRRAHLRADAYDASLQEFLQELDATLLS